MHLDIGQKVSYPSQGVCMVEDIENKKIGDQSISVYLLRVLSDQSIIFVPVANAENVGIRPISSSIQCKKLIARLSADFELVSGDWKSRSKQFGEQLRSGDVFEAADVLKKLTFLSREKKLSFREQTLLDKSKFLIVSEITNANSADEVSLIMQIDKLVDAACNKHAELQPTVMVATAVH
jgi:Transcriptional regulators, similar to M. xanthus CarD